jgi:hypothetical protein
MFRVALSFLEWGFEKKKFLSFFLFFSWVGEGGREGGWVVIVPKLGMHVVSFW